MDNKLILGTVQFGMDYGIHNVAGKPSFDVVSCILDKASEFGIDLLDSAEAYGNAHDVIGKYHRAASSRFRVVTKFSAARNDLPENIRDRIYANLRDLHVDNLYAYMFHSYNDFSAYYPRFEKELKSLRAEGLLKKIGVSIYTNQELEALLAYDGIDLVQLPFNALDNAAQRGNVIQRAKEKGLEVHSRSAFLQGLMFVDPQKLHKQFLSLEPHLAQLRQIAQRAGISLADLALRYCTVQENIDHVLIGVDTPEQLIQNVNSLTEGLHETTRHQVNAIHVEDARMLNPSNWSK